MCLGGGAGVVERRCIGEGACSLIVAGIGEGGRRAKLEGQGLAGLLRPIHVREIAAVFWKRDSRFCPGVVCVVWQLASTDVTLGSLLVSVKGTCPLSVPGPWRIDCVLIGGRSLKCFKVVSLKVGQVRQCVNAPGRRPSWGSCR